MVVMKAFSIPNVSWRTLATGARQLVVQEALERTWCLAGSYVVSLTPRTMVVSGSVAGAEKMTFFTLPRMCLSASSFFLKVPGDSTTAQITSLSQGVFAG